jgi:hypothetical protein
LPINHTTRDFTLDYRKTNDTSVKKKSIFGSVAVEASVGKPTISAT